MARSYREAPCFKCGRTDRVKNLKRVNKLFYCKNCYIQHKKDHRAETIKQAGIAEELRELDNKYQREYRQKTKIFNPRPSIEELPLIKNSSVIKPRVKSNCFLTYEEKKVLPKILNGNNIYQRISMIQRQQYEVRKKIKEDFKAEVEKVENSKIQKNKLLEGLK